MLTFWRVSLRQTLMKPVTKKLASWQLRCWDACQISAGLAEYIALRLEEICVTTCKCTLMSFSITTHKPCLIFVCIATCAHEQGIQFQRPFEMNCFLRLGTESYCLTHWGQGNMAAISQTTFSNAFCSENVWFRLTFHLALTQSMGKVHWNWLVFNQLKSKMDYIKCGPTKYHTNIPLITMQTTPANTQTTNHVKVRSYNLATSGLFY